MLANARRLPSLLRNKAPRHNRSHLLSVAPLAKFTPRRFVSRDLDMGRPNRNTQAIFNEVTGEKESTGIAGLKVVPNAREQLVELYEQILRDLQLIPETAVEWFIKQRLEIIHSEANDQVAEDKIGGGQLEALIEDAKEELENIPFLLEHKPWDVDPEVTDIPHIVLRPEDRN
ncbi:hypothetical protein PROFUN_11488 [Planoprotostelium fungivorum]|uniref:Uncharacterized protein n=1 Tax=Planoprotostelium fungivorum TaxID=1890364 RepID=A0A2P6N9W7_9EUKA|nr:hypothetical protein PROFUN_11488 [Planoprotostelium fungivorum]